MAERNFRNRTLYQGDNLPFLRGMNSGSVNLIATDPPFNKGKDFHATPDSLAKGARFQDRWSWAKDVEQEWVDRIADDWPAVHAVIEAAKVTYGEDMAAFLCFLGVRLMEMHRVLADDGSIYLHIDHTAHAYVKALMDGIFGKRNFRNEIAWCYKSGGVSTRYFAKKHDNILLYSRSNKYTFHPLKVKSYGQSGGGQGGQVQYYRDALGIYSIVAARDWWDISILSTTHSERTGYPTQKPLALYERMIRASSNEGDMVLDPFCGCATTPIAAERLGRQWVGMDIWDGALGIVKQRMENNRQLLSETDPQIHYVTTPPLRTDGGLEAAPFIQVTERYAEPAGPHMTRQQMYEHLLTQHGMRCQGCDRAFDDARYLELDHNTPRSDGGLNHITNRVLLCSPCNRAKSNTYTLSGLRRLNRKNGWMAQ